ncbi:hypothetical protein PAUR_a0179 [Pseudoalteromonas aurantia 208]|uniref:Uncharacterized protein n=1 Tax=Pseudoalteromonas aurantia 208 TaxID=1314867 RepID=A0ABR9E7F5_9GAMM|nr:hypothetical protein [Pseudoalteromonas aurantia 208]
MRSRKNSVTKAIFLANAMNIAVLLMMAATLQLWPYGWCAQRSTV